MSIMSPDNLIVWLLVNGEAVFFTGAKGTEAARLTKATAVATEPYADVDVWR